jgi:FlaA1/EpsC-like NDP-sugar epimerase
VQLIIRAADLVPTPSGARAGESRAQPRSSTFVLEMGDPVRIVDLARNMIRLSGKEPDVDIAIEVVGRRPGEKIHEELFEAGERPEPTPADRIVAAVRPRLDASWVEDAFARIEDLVFNGDAAALADAVAQMSAERSLTAHYVPDPGERGVPDPR